MKSKSGSTQSYTFDCGCSFDVVGPPDASGVPLLDMTGKPRRDCPRVWDMLSAGHTCGVFQLESPLGKNWAKKLSPRTIDHLAALTALLRPGTLNAKDEAGISMTEHYTLRKNGKEECTPIHPAIKSQLEDTYQVLTYQEQSIRIVSDIGGFTEEEADIMRRAMGRKDSKLMEECSVKFIEGAVKKGYPKDDAEFIFSLIRAGERYSFNRCVSGDTIIKRYNTNHRETVKSMYERVKSWPTRYYGYSYSIRGGKLVRNLIKDIYYQGQQELFRVTLEDARYIDVTINHSFSTQDGTKLTLRDLAAGDVIPVFTLANKPAAWVKIASIASLGVGEVYDVEMQAPNHTFVIDNGIITCNSHSYGYGETSYETAYLKAHFPQKFFRAALTIARTSGFWQEKIRDLLNDAISLGVDVRCPDITLRKRNFYTDGKTVWYGINAIKGVGSSSTHKLMDTIRVAVKKYGPLTEWTWPQLLFRVLCGLGKTTVEALIHSGACDAFNVGRVKMQYEYMKVHSLLNRFKDVVPPCNVDEPHVYSVLESMKSLPEVAKTKVRINAFDETIQSLKTPSISFTDTLQLKHSYEQYYLSVPLTVSSLDCAANRRISSGRKFTCRDISSNKKIEKPVEMIAVVKEVKVFKVKKGKNEGREMGSLRISDNTGDAKLVMFADSWSTLSEKIKTNSVYYFTIGQFEDAYTIKDVEEYIGSAEEVKIKEALEGIDYAAV